MKLTLAEPKFLKDSISIISELVSEAVFKINEEGIELVAMDAANVSMVIFKLFSSVFVEYKVEESIDLGVNLSNLKQILRRANPTDMITLSLVGKSKLLVQLSGAFKRKFYLPIIDVDKDEQKVPELSFKATLVMDSRLLSNAIEDADIVSDSLTFEVEKNKLLIKAEGDLSQSESEIPAGEDVSIVLSDENDKIKSKYSIEYLKKMINASKISDKCELKLNNDYPMRLSFSEVDKVSISFILAPRVEYD